MTILTTPILVTGGTGTLGSHVVPLLRAAGREVRILSRHSRESVAPASSTSRSTCSRARGSTALAGVDTVLHLAGGNKGDDSATRNLVRAATNAGVRHLVHISVIGADTMPIG